MSGGPFIGVGKLAEPATRLVERISDAIEGFARPYQIKRIAKAEVTADIIRAEGRIQITDMEQRALDRMVHEEGVKQANIEQITSKAIPHLQKDAKPENVEKDWLRLFFERARLFSNEDMQEMWARLLASEANMPGKHTRKCIEMFSILERRDAELITTLGQMCWQVGKTTCLAFENDDHATQHSAIDISFDDLIHLDALGVVSFSGINTFVEEILDGEICYYFGRPLLVEGRRTEVDVGRALLTELGRELVSICGASPSTAHYNFIVRKWFSSGLILSTPLIDGARPFPAEE